MKEPISVQMVYDNWSAYLRPVDRDDFKEDLRSLYAHRGEGDMSKEECPKCGAPCEVTRGSDPFTFHYIHSASRASIITHQHAHRGERDMSIYHSLIITRSKARELVLEAMDDDADLLLMLNEILEKHSEHNCYRLVEDHEENENARLEDPQMGYCRSRNIY